MKVHCSYIILYIYIYIYIRSYYYWTTMGYYHDHFGYGSVYFVCLRKTECKMTTETFGFWRKVLFNHKQIPMKTRLSFRRKKSVAFREQKNQMLIFYL